MRILDGESQLSLHEVQFYLTLDEARELRDKLDQPLKDPEASDHEHVIADGREMSFSIVTPNKLGRYSVAEQKMFRTR